MIKDKIAVIKYIFWSVFMFGLIVFLSSCGKKSSTPDPGNPGGGAVSVPSAQSIETFPGYKRMKISWHITSVIAKGVVYYGSDSSVVQSDGSDIMSTILTGLSDGNQSFTVYLYDKNGNRSNGQKVTTTVYGDKYTAGLENNDVRLAVGLGENLFISWINKEPSSLGMEVSYTDAASQIRKMHVESGNNGGPLSDYKPGTSIQFRTMFKPTSNAIDTFYAPVTTYSDIQSVQTVMAKNILMNTDQLVREMYRDTSFSVSDGVEETDFYYSNHNGEPMHVFLLRVDMKKSNISLVPAFQQSNGNYTRKTVKNFAESADAPGSRVVAAVNAGFFNLSNGAPVGIVYQNGINYGGGPWRSFLAVMKDGKPYIGDTQDYNDQSGNIQDAIEGSFIVEKNNQLKSVSDASIEPRTAAGVNVDSNFVYFLVADGRIPNYSNGMSHDQLGQMLKACGATDALNYDGGGSSTFVIKNPDSKEFEVRNTPSDGAERLVSTAWMVVVDEP